MRSTYIRLSFTIGSEAGLRVTPALSEGSIVIAGSKFFVVSENRGPYPNVRHVMLELRSEDQEAEVDHTPKSSLHTEAPL